MAAPWRGQGHRGQGHGARAPALGTSPPNSWILPPSQLQTPAGTMSPWGGSLSPGVPSPGVKAEGQQQQPEAGAGSPPRRQQMLQHWGPQSGNDSWDAAGPPSSVVAAEPQPRAGGALGGFPLLLFVSVSGGAAGAGGVSRSRASRSAPSRTPARRRRSARRPGASACRGAGLRDRTAMGTAMGT